MSTVPTVVRVGDTLVAALSEDIDDEAAMELGRTICERVEADGVPAVVLDISAAHFVDSFICRVVSDIAAMGRLLGAQVAVVGMRPAVAITLVELGLTLDGVVTARNVDEGRDALAAAAAGGRGEVRRGDRGRRRR